MEPRSPTLELAEQAMKARRFGEAIAGFEAHLAEWPDDVRALLRLGLCHLLDRSEETFVAIHGRARALIEKLREVPADLARLWAHYQQLLRKVSATALVVGAMALPACQSQARAGQVSAASRRRRERRGRHAGQAPAARSGRCGRRRYLAPDNPAITSLQRRRAARFVLGLLHAQASPRRTARFRLRHRRCARRSRR